MYVSHKKSLELGCSKSTVFLFEETINIPFVRCFVIVCEDFYFYFLFSDKGILFDDVYFLQG